MIIKFMVVIPAVNAVSFDDAREKILKAAEFSDWIHIDVVDGKFAPNKIWGNPEDLLLLKSYFLNLNLEVHLMVINPEEVIEAWLKTGLVKRIVVHLESLNDAESTINKCKEYGAEAMLAITPDTILEKLSPAKFFALSFFNSFQVLAVKPGFAGQKFERSSLDKIKFLIELAPGATIEVDGGINAETAKLVKEAGADIVVSASYIFNAPNPRKAYEELKSV